MESRAPERTCIGCRRRNKQASLIRISRNQEGRFALATGDHRHGRGAYICPDTDCIDAALKGDRIGRALKQKVDETEKEDLRTALTERCTQPAEN